MKKLYPVALALAIQLIAPGCFRQEVQTAEYHIPEMNTPATGAYIQNRLKGIPGIVKSSFELENQVFTVRYQSSIIRTMNIEEAIALAGFSVNNRPANPNAKIPEGVK